MKNNRIQKIIKRIESIEGETIINILNRLYVQDKMPLTEIMKRWNTSNNRIVPKLLRMFNIPIRTYSENIQLQWVNNEHRKQEQSKRFNENKSKVPHFNLGKTKETCKRLQESSDRMRVFNPMFDENIIIKTKVSHIKSYRENPYQHPNAKAKPTVCEQTMINHINNLGYETKFNYLVFPYWIDIFIPILNLGIECFGDTKRSTPFDYIRHNHITSQNIHIIYISNYFIKKSFFSYIDNYISNLQIVRYNPSFGCKNTVIWGATNNKIFKNNTDELIVDHVHMNHINILYVTASTDNLIVNPQPFNINPTIMS
jgi:hypothetical protein